MRVVEKIQNIKIDTKRKCYGYYTLLFCVVSILFFSCWFLAGKGLIWNIDGSKQHYPALVYLGQYLREIISDFISTGQIHFTKWDINLGYGYDVLTTLNYYSFGDPLDLLSVFVSPDYTEYLYSFLVVLRLYLAGAAFIAFANYRKWNMNYIVVGAIVYVFSGNALFLGLRHPFFLNPMIYLPLLLLGIDKLISKKQSVLFLVMVSISLISNFYFFFMLSIAMFIYAIRRVYEIYDRPGWKTYIQHAAKCIALYLVGVCNAMVVFFPVLLSFLGTARSDGELPQNILLYPLSYYFNLIPSTASYGTIDYSTSLGFLSVGLFALVLSIVSKEKQFSKFKFYFILSGVALLFPIFGYILNGCSYIANRWVFMLAFVIACCFCQLGSRLFELTKKQFRILSIVAVIYGVLTLFISVNRNEKNLVSCLFLIVALLTFYCSINCQNQIRKLMKLCMVFLLVIECFCKGIFVYGVADGGIASEYYNVGEARERLTNTGVSLIKKKNNKGVYRVDACDRESRNYSILEDIPTVSTYFSITPECVSRYMKDVGNAKTENSFSIGNLDGRTTLNTLFGVKYITTNTDLQSATILPCGYKKKWTRERENYKGETVNDIVYENKSSLPLLYSYDKCISSEQWENYTQIEKEQAMLSGCYAEQKTGLPMIETKQEHVSVNVEKAQILNQIKAADKDNIRVEGDKIIVTEKYATVPILLNKRENSETYLQIQGVEFEAYSPSDVFEKTDTNQSWNDRYMAYQKGKGWLQPQKTTITVVNGEKRNIFELQTKYSRAVGMDSAVLNAGYSKKGLEKCEIVFGEPGEYTFKDLSMVSVNMDQYKDKVDKLKNESSNIKIHDNSVTAKLTCSSSKMLCLAIPYSSGWKAYVNGEEKEIYQINDMFMGVVSEPGENEIQFSYTTPGLKQGMILTLIGIAMSLLYVIYILVKKGRKRHEG
ncbi:MAG: YfhO family protein [Eubacterium sp.]|nr:YfhO family protein [Eubacterium sp.]